MAEDEAGGGGGGSGQAGLAARPARPLDLDGEPHLSQTLGGSGGIFKGGGPSQTAGYTARHAVAELSLESIPHRAVRGRGALAASDTRREPPPDRLRVLPCPSRAAHRAPFPAAWSGGRAPPAPLGRGLGGRAGAPRHPAGAG